MSEVNKNLGHATAYGYAKSKGYTGTEEQFAELMASYADVAEDAAQSASEAAQSATAAAASATNAASSASGATQSAQSASASATSASQSATAATSAVSTAQTAAQTATTKASEASQSATTAQTQAQNAMTHASNAQTFANNAQTSATQAAASATTANDSANLAVEVAESIPEDYTDLSNTVSDLLSALYHKEICSVDDYQQGVWGASGGAYNSTITTAICNINNIPANVAVIACSNEYKIRLQAWDDNGYYRGVFDGTGFVFSNPNYFQTKFDLFEMAENFPVYRFRVCMFKADDTGSVTPSDATYLWYLYLNEKDILTPQMLWRNGTPSNSNNLNGITLINILPNDSATSLTIVVNVPLTEGHKYRYTLTTYTISEGKTIESVSYRVTSDKEIFSTNQFANYKLDDGSIGFAICLTERDSDNVAVPLRVETFDTSKISVIRNYDVKTIETGDYMVDATFLKTNLVGTKYVGQIKGSQGFCKYDGYYYSSSGNGTLYKQDSSLTQVATASLALGHCNCLQLGHNGKAYASGWDDQKVYEVDLATMTITNTYTLPTTGYTTVAVDDMAGLMYIFQRDTSPGSAEEAYNFITYDYVNEQIVSSRKTPIAFGAQQGLDFVNGRIFVTYGLGTNAIPNGYVVFDTNGNVLCEYVFNSFATSEPQGVIVDRDTYDIYIKIDGTSLRKVIRY